MNAVRPRGGTAAERAAAMPVFAAREIAVTTDTGDVYVGDGVTPGGKLAGSNAFASIVDATADGVTDAAPAIQAHLDAAAIFGIKTVIIAPKAGTYMLGSPLYAENVTIQAYGATLKAMTSLVGAMLTCKNQKVAVLAPSGVAATPSGTGGTLAAGTYYYVVSAVTAAGETPVSLLKSATTTGTTGSVSVTWVAPTVPAGGSAITGYRIYGRTRGAFVRIGTAAAGATSWTDTGAAGTGESLPAANATFSRTASLRVFGGTWDSDGNNRAGDIDWVTSGKTAGHAFDFQKIDDLIVRDVTINNAKCWSIAIADFGHIVTENIKFASLRDGIHVVGPGKSWTARTIRGSAPNDDMLAVATAEWDWMSVSHGSVEKVLIEDVYAEAAGVYTFLRVLGSAGTRINSLTVRNIRGTWPHLGSGAIRVQDDQYSTHQLYPNGTDIDTLVIEDINLTTTAGGPNPYVYLAGRNLDRVRIRDIRSSSTTQQESVKIENFPGAGTVCTIGELYVGGLSRNAWGRQNVSIDAASVVTRMTLEEPKPLLKGKYHSTPHLGASAGAFAVGDMNFTAIDPPAGGRITRLGANVTSAGTAGAKIRLGIYHSDVNGLPGALAVDGGTIDATVTGPAEVTVNFMTTGRRLWLAAVSETAQSTVRTFQVPSTVADNLAYALSTTLWGDCGYATNGGIAAGGLPATAPAFSLNSGAVAVVAKIE